MRGTDRHAGRSSCDGDLPGGVLAGNPDGGSPAFGDRHTAGHQPGQYVTLGASHAISLGVVNDGWAIIGRPPPSARHRRRPTGP